MQEAHTTTLGNCTFILHQSPDDFKEDFYGNRKEKGGNVSLRLDTLTCQLVCGIALIEALAEAVASGSSDPTSYKVDEEDKQNCQNDSFEAPRGMTIIANRSRFGDIKF